MVEPAFAAPTRPPTLVSPAAAPLVHTASTLPQTEPANGATEFWPLRTWAFGSPSARTTALPRSAANSPEWLRARLTNRLWMEWPRPSNTALKCVVLLGAVAGPMGSQPLPPLW